MKKLLAILLLLTMCVGALAACSNGKTGATLEEAAEYLVSTYKADEGKSTPNDYKLIAQVMIGQDKFEINWTVDNETIKITLEGSYYEVDVPAKNDVESTYTLTATIKDAKGKTIEKKFSRKLPEYDNSAAVTKPVEGDAYKLFLVQANKGQTLFATAEVQGENKYIKTDIDPKKGVDFYAEEVEGGYKFYTEINGVKNYVHAQAIAAEDGKVSKYIGYATESDCVYYYKSATNAWYVTIDKTEYVVGTYGDYTTISISESTYMTAENSGVTQFPVLLMNKAAAEALNPSEGPADPTELSTIPQLLEIAGKLENSAQTPEKYLVKGKIVEIKNTTYGNLYIEDEAGNKLYVYGVYDKTGANRYDVMNPQPKVGDTVTLMGVLSKYNDEGQMKNGWITELIPGEGTDVTPPETNAPDTPVVPDAPVDDVKENTAYKFYLNQVKVSKVLYMTTEISGGKYIAGATDAKTAADFYAEKVEGGYKFYTTIDGAKQYLHASLEAKDDGKTSKYLGFAAESDNVWYYKEDVKAWYVTLSGAEYVMGTYNDFETFSISDSKFMTPEASGVSQFPGTLILKEDAESITPPETNAPDTPVVPDAPVDEVKENTEYKFFLSQVTAGKVLYMTAELQDNKYIIGTTDAAAALNFFAEKVEGGYKFYTTIDGAKMYLHAHVEPYDDGSGKMHKYIGYAAESDNVWSYKAETNGWYVTLDGAEYVVGTYSTYETFCISDSKFLTAANTGKEQFPAGLILKTEAESGDAPEVPDTPAEPEAGDKTIVEFNTIASAQPDKGDATTNKYTVTGKITEIKHETYGNMYIEDESGNKLYIYGVYSADGKVRYDELNPQPKVGDTITITGVACNYGGPQMKNGWILKLNGADYVTEAPAEVPDDSDASISFADVANRTEQDGTKQVWVQNGITVTNNRSASQNPVADYSNPARFYKDSQLIIACNGMTKIVITCNNASYATALQASAVSAGTATVEGKVVTITLDAAVDSVTFAALSAQVRVDMIQIYK